MGFDGVVISDDMQMRAISHHFGLEQAVVTAINSGVDMLAYGNNLDFDPDIVISVKRILKNAVDDGSLDISRVDQAYERIRKIKQRITT
jgi:beta-N-acetylhexosaminidase